MAASSFTVIGIGTATLDPLSIVPEFRADEHMTRALVEDDGGPVARCAEHASRLATRNAAGLGGRHALNLEV